MRTTLDYIGNKKLNLNSTNTASGSAEVVTGLTISTGTNSGDFVELTDAQAQQVGAVGGQTLFGGIYQRVKFSATAQGGTFPPNVGEPVFWNPSDSTDPYPVINNPAYGTVTNSDFAGVVIDPSTTSGQYCWIQVTGKATCTVNGNGAVNDYVTFPTTNTRLFAVGTAAPTGNLIVGCQLFAGTAGSGSLVLTDITRAQSKV